MSNYKILLVDPDAEYAAYLRCTLADPQYDIIHTADADNCIQLIALGIDFSLILIENDLINASGSELCHTLRNTYNVCCPITLLSAAFSSDEVIQGLQNGADNFLNKNADEKEFLARLQAILRSTALHYRAPSLPEDALHFGDLHFYTQSQTVYLNDRKLKLTPHEYRLLLFLCRHPNEAFSREVLYHKVWGTTYGDTSTVTVTIKKLRDKLGNEHPYIQTIWGVGYRFAPMPQTSDNPRTPS